MRMTRYDDDFDAVVGALEQQTPTAWNKHYLLKGQLALPLDADDEAEPGRFRVRYSSELVIEILSDGRSDSVG